MPVEGRLPHTQALVHLGHGNLGVLVRARASWMSSANSAGGRTPLRPQARAAWCAQTRHYAVHHIILNSSGSLSRSGRVPDWP